ncbi:MAG: serine/threonine protein kinase [Akkermansiaceae bacterium]|nr:serine/threonine protein kinase [Akkermansiaceae bacterium]
MSIDTSPAIEIEGAILETAVSLDETSVRQAFLDRAFRDDPAGLARMQSLVSSARQAATFFVEAGEYRADLAATLLTETGLSDPSPHRPDPDGPGSIIGIYRLIRRIGEGGCGVVYEAEQDQLIRRRVAIKIIRLGMDTEAVIARFEIERQSLAMMNHPNISRIFDAGATAKGRPYFAMELVDGEKITSFCDRQRLDIPARLALFLSVCSAIQHAHQKGVIHRDIKPSNILVTQQDGESIPKVIDFGIAKATEARLGVNAWTSYDQLIGTPAYMSPEQIDMVGIDVDTRSDIYSLGVLLCELLVSRPPFLASELMASGVSEMRRIILNSDRPKPSQLLATIPPEELREVTLARRTDLAKLAIIVRGDLGWIVMKAMQSNRNRRYQTVNALAADIQRTLDNQPVSARPPGGLYTLGKFVRRNQVAVASGVAVIASLVVGLGTSTLLYIRARDANVEATRAGSAESYLRHQAQARANLSKAAILLADGNVSEADALLKENPLESIEPSREAADLFRSLARLNAAFGRWAEAAHCYTVIRQGRVSYLQANVDDILTVGPAFLENNDLAAYETFRQDALASSAPGLSTTKAQETLKACLLMPATPKILEALEPAAKLCVQHLSDEISPHNETCWEAFSTALYYYRKADAEAALAYTRQGLAAPVLVDAGRASLLFVAAMSSQDLGQKDQAKKDFEEAVALSRHAYDPVSKQLNLNRPFWFDWSVLAILHREAARKLDLEPQ